MGRATKEQKLAILDRRFWYNLGQRQIQLEVGWRKRL
jgi:hypothetical protein